MGMGGWMVLRSLMAETAVLMRLSLTVFLRSWTSLEILSRMPEMLTERASSFTVFTTHSMACLPLAALASTGTKQVESRSHILQADF